MQPSEELGAIIGGSVAGVVVLIIVVGVIVYFCCGSRRRRQRREIKKYPQLTPSPESSHSQHSTLSHVGDPRLPKVSSNGLWVGTPGVYASTPSPAYYYGRPAGYRMEPTVQRTNSESGLHGVPGHAVYQNNVRIYHSQQLAPVYEVVGSRGMMDVYQYDLAHSRSRLIDRNSLDRRDLRDREAKKIKRSHSDLADRSRKHHPKKRPENSRPQAQVHERNEKVADQRQKSKSLGSLKTASYENQAFEDSPPTSAKVETTTVSASATDSMKLQAKESKNERLSNITDDEKQVTVPIPETKNEQESDKEEPVSYPSDLYYVPPANSRNSKPEGYENPIIARMEEMILEKTGEKVPKPIPVSIEPDINPEDTEVVNANLVPTVPDPLSAAALEKKHGGAGSGDETRDRSVSVNRPQEGASHSSPDTHVKHEGSDDPDGASIDLGVAGKHITTAAFKFLDNYLSDEEGGDFQVDSPPMSPHLETRNKTMEY